ncbi:MAG: hypothetical protein N2554_08530 [Fimbriimonadales bacterium]|nr:hypothetical protein [Fimbriimonadales bacterium]
MTATEVLEGVFEEIAAQRPELRRKRVRIIVLPETPAQQGEPTLYERLKPHLGQVRLQGSPGADRSGEVARNEIANQLLQERMNGAV